MDSYHQEGLGPSVCSGRHVPWYRKTINIIGCLLSLPLYWYMTAHCRYPVTLDLVVTIALAELNRFINQGRRLRFYAEESRPREKMDSEKLDLELQPPAPRLDCIAAVVGWREDPALFTRAMESYKAAKSCKFLLVGIDGDEVEDMDMVRVFNKVGQELSQVYIHTRLDSDRLIGLPPALEGDSHPPTSGRGSRAGPLQDRRYA